MRWWIRSQHPVWVVAVALLGTIVVIASPHVLALPVPAFAGSAAFTAIRPHALVATLITVVSWASVSAGHKSAILSATRASKLFVFIFVSAVIAMCVLVAGVWAVLTNGETASLQLLVRDLVGLFGLGLILAPLTGYRYAGIIATVYVFLAAIFGRTNGDEGSGTALWAWPISELTSFDRWIPASALFLIGAMLSMLRPSRQLFFSRAMVAQGMDMRRE